MVCKGLHPRHCASHEVKCSGKGPCSWVITKDFLYAWVYMYEPDVVGDQTCSCCFQRDTSHSNGMKSERGVVQLTKPVRV